ncbi:MAG: hypothetical protein RPR40_07935 [Bermanella sp.]
MSNITEKKADFAALVARFNGWQTQPLRVLLTWINNDAALARVLTTEADRPVTPRTVTAWRKGERVPSKNLAALLYVISDGTLTPNLILSDEWQSIIECRGWSQ